MTPAPPQKRPHYYLLFSLLMAIFLFFGLSLGPGQAFAEKGPSKGKKSAYIGNPAAKRGVEYGFDKGYQAGKADLKAGLEPDPKRHEDFNNPDKYYRYEFGNRAAFVRGFTGGYVGGYQKAFGKKVKIKVSGSGPLGTGKAQTAEPTAAPKPSKPSAVSDAL